MTDDRIEQPAPNSVPSEEAAAPAEERAKERSEAVTEAAARGRYGRHDARRAW